MKQHNLSQEKPTICIVSHNAYGVLSGTDTGHAGGIEVQTPLMARWLTKNGYKVSFITWDTGHEDGETIDGIKVYKLCRKDAGLPIFRFFVPRWSSLLSALNKANADIVYYNCGDLCLGQIALWTRRKKRKLIYSVPSDIDCKKELPALVEFRERVLYKFGLKRANIIITQTNTQKNLLKNEFGLDSIVIRMPSEGMNKHRENHFKSGDNLRALWVGRFNKEKRLEWLLDVAQQLPEINFDILGDANVPSTYSQNLKNRADNLNNVKMHGRIPHTNMHEYYLNADIICSTSIYEGFPNVFLEAWSVGLPLVTTFDPDRVVEQFGHGKVASTIETLKDSIIEFTDPDLRKSASDAAINYFNNYHNIDKCMESFSACFMDRG